MAEYLDVRYDVVRNAGKRGELLADGNVTITMQSDAGVKTDLKGSFQLRKDFDKRYDYIRPVYCRNGVWEPLGLFVVTDVSMHYNDAHGTMDLTGMDFGYYVQRKTAETRPFYAEGRTYTDVIQTMLAECGVTKVRNAASDLRLRHNREEWEAGVNYMEVINLLLAEINYDPLWFDSAGWARIGYISPKDPPMHSYIADEASIIEPAYSIITDDNDAYNVFVGYVSGPEEDLRAVAENNDPGSSISIPILGRRNAKYYKLSDIASQEELQNYVNAERNRYMSGTEQVDFTSAIRSHGVGDTVYLNHHYAHGIFRETGYSITLGPGGGMTHTVQRVVLL